MEVLFLDQAWEDYLFWQHQDKKILKKINNILKDIDRHPFEGIGSPEPLKHDLKGYWSRRITLEHRLVCLQNIDKQAAELYSLFTISFND
ncbi:MAG: Txe/YoeB family addiction module toxin [Marinoscillum sp.]